uniref:Carboxypeptidase Q n=1 Tax=Ditylenchus dipsaci TaxID=166011 RepID=A0A915CL75_9BILA
MLQLACFFDFVLLVAGVMSVTQIEITPSATFVFMGSFLEHTSLTIHAILYFFTFVYVLICRKDTLSGQKICLLASFALFLSCIDASVTVWCFTKTTDTQSKFESFLKGIYGDSKWPAQSFFNNLTLCCSFSRLPHLSYQLSYFIYFHQCDSTHRNSARNGSSDDHDFSLDSSSQLHSHNYADWTIQEPREKNKTENEFLGDRSCPQYKPSRSNSDNEEHHRPEERKGSICGINEQTASKDGQNDNLVSYNNCNCSAVEPLSKSPSLSPSSNYVSQKFRKSLFQLLDYIQKQMTLATDKAIDFTVEKLKEDSFDNVHTEQKIETERASRFPLNAAEVTASVVVLKDFKEFEATNVTGKIVLFSPLWQGYGKTVAYRGALQRVKTKVVQWRHWCYNSNWMHSNREAELIERLYNRQKEIVVQMSFKSTMKEDTSSRNTVFEIKGSQWPNQIVLLSAHMDSWDVGQGAMDDGGGMAAVTKFYIYFTKKVRSKEDNTRICWNESQKNRIEQIVQLLNEYEIPLSVEIALTREMSVFGQKTKCWS